MEMLKMSNEVLIGLMIVNAAFLLYGFYVFGKYGEDAGRYRWLRRQDWTKNKLSVVVTATLTLGDNTYSGTRLDDVVDAYRTH